MERDPHQLGITINIRIIIPDKMKNSVFHKFFVEELKDLYWAENALLKDLPNAGCCNQ